MPDMIFGILTGATIVMLLFLLDAAMDLNRIMKKLEEAEKKKQI